MYLMWIVFIWMADLIRHLPTNQVVERDQHAFILPLIRMRVIQSPGEPDKQKK